MKHSSGCLSLQVHVHEVTWRCFAFTLRIHSCWKCLFAGHKKPFCASVLDCGSLFTAYACLFLLNAAADVTSVPRFYACAQVFVAVLLYSLRRVSEKQLSLCAWRIHDLFTCLFLCVYVCCACGSCTGSAWYITLLLQFGIPPSLSP